MIPYITARVREWWSTGSNRYAQARVGLPGGGEMTVRVHPVMCPPRIGYSYQIQDGWLCLLIEPTPGA